jgi:hypothetical protein
MKLLSVVHDDWSAAMTERLAASRLICAVAVADEAANRLWRKCPAAKHLDHLAEPEVDAEGLGAVDEVLVFGRPILPRWIPSALASVGWIQVTAACEDGLVVSDPVHWCIRHAQRSFHLRLHRSGPDLPEAPTLAETLVHLPGLDYQDSLAAVAESLAVLLSAARTAETPPGEYSATFDPFPLDRLKLRIDWAAPAEVVIRLIRSGAGRVTPAWTYLNGFPVSIGAGDAVEMEPCTLAAGTIVRRDTAGVVVQTGTGMVRISQVRDALGPLPITTLRLGLRLGIDAEEDLRMLRRRVADLERTVQWMLTERRPKAEPVRYQVTDGHHISNLNS